MTDQPIVLTNHARDRCPERGASEENVVRAIREGEREPAQRGLWQYRMNFEYNKEWVGNWYAVQQVTAIVDDEPERFVMVTVYTFYF